MGRTAQCFRPCVFLKYGFFKTITLWNVNRPHANFNKDQNKSKYFVNGYIFFFPMPPHVPYGLRGLPFRLWPKTSKVGTPMRRSYFVPMRWMVIYEYEVPGGALNLSSTKLPRPWSPWGSTPSRKSPHGRTGNRTRDLMISSQKLWPLEHEAGLNGYIIYVKSWDFSGGGEKNTLVFSGM
jgi:hypothetical protein